MATLTVQSAAITGTALSYANCAAGGDQFAITDSRCAIIVVNGHASNDYNVTIANQTNCSYGVDHDLVVAVPAGAERLIGPFEYARFKDANGLVQLAYSATASVTVAYLRLP
jgi:hypothetical protein